MEPDNQTKQVLVRRLMIFLALVYVAEGLGQTGGLISQPLSYYLKEICHWQADRVTEFLLSFNFPWVIKPLYGIVSDWIPILGYRRRPYLILANGLATGGYLWLSGVSDPGIIMTCLMITASGMAVSSTVCGGVMVENGQKLSLSGVFVNQQWLWFSIASVFTSAVGGWMCQNMGPAAAMHTAALVVAMAPLLVMFTCWFLVAEEKSQINMPEFKKSGRALGNAFKSKVLWVVGAFLFLYNFSPSFGTPLYYYMTDTLRFRQDLIGYLGAISSIGSIIGAFCYIWLQKRLTMKQLLLLSIIVGALAQGAYVFLVGTVTAIVLSLVNGIIGMIALVASLTLAADACPSRAEGFSYAALMSISNLAGMASAYVGGILYVQYFHNHLTPLIIVSSLFTLLCLVLIPILKLGDRRPGVKWDTHDSAGDRGSRD